MTPTPRKAVSAGLAIVFFTPSIVIAAETATKGEDPINMTVTMFKTAGGLALIIGLILTAVWLLRRFGGQVTRGGTRNSIIRILDTRMLGQKKYLSVISIGSRTLAVGVTEQSITLLAEIVPEDIPARETIPATQTFADVFKNLTRAGIKRK